MYNFLLSAEMPQNVRMRQLQHASSAAVNYLPTSEATKGEDKNACEEIHLFFPLLSPRQQLQFLEIEGLLGCPPLPPLC